MNIEQIPFPGIPSDQGFQQKRLEVVYVAMENARELMNQAATQPPGSGNMLALAMAANAMIGYANMVRTMTLGTPPI